MSMTYSDNNAYINLGNVANNLDDAKAAFVAAQARVDAETALRNTAKTDLDAAFAAYISTLQSFDGLMATPPPGYVATPPQQP
jgi:hypothetical protein